MVISRQQNAEKNHDLKTDNKPTENVAKVIHLGTKVTNENYIP